MEAPLSGDPPAGRGGEDLSSRWAGATASPTLPERIRSWLLADAPAAPAGVAGLQVPLAVTLAVFGAAFLVPAWPWLSGRVTIPWDAKSQFFPQLQFLATSIAHGEWPWWTPNVFAGWPEISDPQSLMFSPLHVLLALFNSAISLRAFDAVIFAYLCLGGIGIILFFRDRGWHAGGAVVAALAFAFGGAASARLQHIGQVMSLVYLVLVLWLLARALDRGSWRAGLGAGAIAGLMAIGRDQVALLSLYVLAGFVVAHWFTGAGRHRADARECEAARCRRAERGAARRRSGRDDDAAGGKVQPSGDQLRDGGRRLDPSAASAAIGLRGSVRRDGSRISNIGARRLQPGMRSGAGRDSISRRTCRWSMRARCRSWRSSRSG